MSKVVIVSGGSGEIGEEICKTLVENGYTVFFTYYQNIKKAKEIESYLKIYASDSKSQMVDITDSASIKNLVSKIESTNEIYGLINCTGISISADPLLELEEVVWDRIHNVNLKGTYLMCKYILPLILKNGKGRIINISSIHGQNPPALRTAYSSSKAGVIALTKSLAKEVAQYNICVNAICPGPVRTDMLEKIWMISAKKENISFEDYEKSKLNEIPIGKLCEPIDVAESVLFLLSDCSAQITGAVININGGAY